jgi:putative permease
VRGQGEGEINMIAVITNWCKRYFSDPEAAYLFLFMAFAVIAFYTVSAMLMPLIVSIVLAYLLDWPILWLNKKLKMPRLVAVIIVFVLFISICVLILVGLLPLLSHQLTNLLMELPKNSAELQANMTKMIQHIPLITEDQAGSMVVELQLKFTNVGKQLLSNSLTFIPNLVAIVVYLVMVPLLVYFFLADKARILGWLSYNFIPQKRSVLLKVWQEVHVQIGNYIRGKFLEAIMVLVVTYVSFLILGLEYSLLLAALVGLSVFIPYIGAIVVTIPVIAVGLIQWGASPQFWYLVIVYSIIIAVDGNLLVPLLFSEAVALHPIAIIVAILIFGGLWGFWGIFFAIPLAALVKSLLDNWPVKN